MDQITYAATQAGIILVASAGNDGYDLSNPRYVELPAQARGVLAIVASTNAACAENLTANATCALGPVTLPYYSNYGAPLNALAAPGGSYPSGGDMDVSGWVRGACSSGKPIHHRRPARRLRPQLRLLQPRSQRVRPGHRNQRRSPARRRRRRPAPRCPSHLGRRHHRGCHAFISNIVHQYFLSTDQRRHRALGPINIPCTARLRVPIESLHPFIRSLTLFASLSISSAFLITSRDRMF